MFLIKGLEFIFPALLQPMHIFGIGGSASKQKSKSKSKTQIDKRATTTEELEKQTTGTQRQTGEQRTDQVATTLDEETQQVLQDLIQSFGGTLDTASGVSVTEQLAGLADQLITRAGETEAAIGEQTGAIVDEARRTGQQEVGRLQTQLASSVGSSQGSFVTGATAEAQAGLESQLAALESSLGIQARQAGSQDLSQAFAQLATVPGAGGQEANTLVNLVNALKGGTATTTGTTATDQQINTSELVQQNAQTLEEILQFITQESKSKGKSSGLNFGIEI